MVRKEKKLGTLEADSVIEKLRAENKVLRKKYKEALGEISKKKQEIDVSKIGKIETFHIKPKRECKINEGVAFCIASDWHVDEIVRPFMVNGMNKFNDRVAKERSIRFFQNAVKLVHISGRDVEINTIVLGLLGDFISSNIKEELKENTSMLPMEAIMYAQTLIASGINYVLKHTKANIVVQCHAGNHSRITKKIHISTEVGNSLEALMYSNLELHYTHEKRVTFNISKGYHSFLKIFDKTIRFHHGHHLRYQGGVGGIYIPVNKAIAQWNKMKPVDLDVFGHFHQFRDGGNFICNGSLIGYSAYALSIKADYEDPKQAFFLLDKKRGKTIVAPIILNRG